MTKKSTIFKVLLLVFLVALTAFALVACDDANGGGGGTNGGGGGTAPESTTFTVTFSSEGSSITYPSQTVKYGEKLVKPINDPVKTGYTFQGWYYTTSSSTSVDWNFDTAVVTSAIALKAKYTANTYAHPLYLTADESTPYTVGTDEQKFTSTYGSIASAVMPVPQRNGDQFLYWYYFADTDSDPTTPDEEVMFSYWTTYTVQTAASSYTTGGVYYVRNGAYYTALNSTDADYPANKDAFSDASKPAYFKQADLKEKTAYTNEYSLRLHAKWYSDLTADNSVSFLANGGTMPGSVLNPTSVKSYSPVSAFTATRDGYKLAGWFVAEEDADGAYVLGEKHYKMGETEFKFDDGTKDKEFDLVSTDVVLIAKWTRAITVSNASDWTSLYDLCHLSADATEADKTAYAELLTAEITLANSITLTGTDNYALFSAEKPFAGTFNGGGNTLTVNLTSLQDKVSAPFVAVSGTIKDAKFVLNADITSLSDPFGDESDRTFIISGAVGLLTGTVQDTTYNFNFDMENLTDSMSRANFTLGGLAAYSNGGTISKCSGSVNVTSAHNTIAYGDVLVGGVVGSALNSTITNAVLTTVSIVCDDADNVYAGGITAVSTNSKLTYCRMDYTAEGSSSSKMKITVSADSTAYAGGLVGKLVFGSIASSYVYTDFAGEQSVISVLGDVSYAGGLVGYNNGKIQYAYSRNVAVSAACITSAYAGGIAGISLNGSTSDAHGLIDNCYAVFASDSNSIQGSVSATATSSLANANLYAGGLTGSAQASRIKSSFAFINVTVEILSDAHSYHLGYIAGEATTTQSWTAYADNSKDGETPIQALTLLTQSGATVYNGDNLTVCSYGTSYKDNSNFRSGSWLYNTLSMSKTYYYLESGDPLVYCTDYPALKITA